MYCEYCEADATVADDTLGNVCEECQKMAEATFEETGVYVVAFEEEWDVIRDARDGY